MGTKGDARQTISRDFLDQVISTDPGATGSELDNILRSINEEITPPLRLLASNPADLIVTIESIFITNPETSRKKVISQIANTIPYFTSGTVTFPSSPGGTVTVSPGDNTTLPSISSGEIVIASLNLDSDGDIVVQFGDAGTTVFTGTPATDATVPDSIPNVYGIGLVIISNDSGTIQNIQNTHIYQFSGNGILNSGDTVAPATNTDNSIPRWNGVDSKTLQDSGVTIDDSNNVAIPGGLNIATSSGSVGIGTDSPSNTLHVYNNSLRIGSKTGDTSTQQNTDSLILAGIPNSSTEWCGIEWYREFSDTIGAQIIAARPSSTESQTDLIFKTNSGAGSPTERMRINNVGEVGIGPDQVAGVLLTVNDVPAAASTPTVLIKGGGSSGQYYLKFALSSNGAELGKIQRDGTSSAVLYTTTSDETLKEDFQPITNALNTVMLLTPQNYKWKNSEDRRDGFGAQTLYNIYPQAVYKPEDNDENSVWGVDKSALVPILTKAIQEQQEIIDELKNRIEILES